MTVSPQPHTPGKYDISDKLTRLAAAVSGDPHYGTTAKNPLFLVGGEGAILQDMDENQYVDFTLGGGTQLHGHGFAPVQEAVAQAASFGLTFDGLSDKATYLCDLIQERHRYIDQVLLLNSAAEALQVLKASFFSDTATTLGVGCDLGDKSLPFNDIKVLKKTFVDAATTAVFISPWGEDGTAISDDYLVELRTLCDSTGALIIADERITGFRAGFGSAQEVWPIRLDITFFGRQVGGGLPLVALAGGSEAMARLTYSQLVRDPINPVAVAAGCAHLEQLTQETYQTLASLTDQFAGALRQITSNKATVSHQTGAIWLRFTENHDEKIMKLRDAGVFWPEIGPALLSTAHNEKLRAHTLTAFKALCGAL